MKGPASTPGAHASEATTSRLTGSLRERKRVFDTGWMILALALSLTAGLVAYVDPARFDATAVGWGLFAYGALYLAAARWLEHDLRERRFGPGAFASQVVGVLLLGALWYRLGGLNNPGLLLAFSVPVAVACIHTTSWQVGVVAALCVGVVGTGALLESPELRWYLAQAGVPGAALLSGGGTAPDTTRPFADAALSPGQRLTLLASFSLGIVTLAVAADGFRGVLDRLGSRVREAEKALASDQRLALQWLRASVHPALLVYADSAVVVDVSDSFESVFGEARGNAVGRSLFEIVDWSHPDTVEDLIHGGGGELKTAAHRISDRLCIGRVHVRRVAQQGRECACITIVDESEPWLLRQAFDQTAGSLLLVGADGRIAHANGSAQALFPEARTGAPAAEALRLQDAPEAWWQPAPLRHVDLQIPLADGPRPAHCTALRFPGETDAWTLVRVDAGRRR